MTLLDVILIVAVAICAWLYWRTRRASSQLRDAFAKHNTATSELKAQLRASEARAAALSDAPPHLLLVFNPDSTIVHANARASELLGKDLTGLTVIEATRSHEIDAVVQNALRAHQTEERPVTWNARPYFARAVPIADGGAVLVLEDQTDRLRLERVRRDFVANVSHELRTPLASIRLLIETLLAGANDDPEASTRMLNQVIGEVDSLTQLAQELLDLSLIESGQTPMQIERANLHQVAEEQLIHFGLQAQQKQITAENNVTPGLLAEIDPKMIGRVLGNLLHNAIKFTPNQGRIAIGAVQADHQIIVSVTDTGPGIPPEDLPRIFERFYKVDRARGKGGTGLGLAIARHVVEAHGGRIWAESAVGKGATFYFTIPAAK